MLSTIKHIAPILLLLLSACEEATQWNLQSENLNVLIVDGIITNERKPHEIKLSRSYPELNQEAETVSGAVVTVSDSVTNYLLSEVAEKPGTYRSDTFQAVVGRNYHLEITLQNQHYEARAAGVPVNPYNPIYYTPVSDTSGLYQYQYTGVYQAAMTRVDYNWSHVPGYCSHYGNCQAREIFYTLWNNDVNEVFKPETDFVKFPSGTLIVQRKYSLSDAHQYFLRSLLMETQWSGGVFDVQHGNIPTNLSNGALGFFAVCMVVTDSARVAEK